MAAPALSPPPAASTGPGAGSSPASKAKRAPLSPEERRRRRVQLFWAALSGVLYVVAFPGVDQSYLALVAFVPVLLAARGESVRRALWLGAITGFVSHLGGYYWVVHLLREFAYLPVPAAVLGWLLVCVGQGASFGVGLAVARWLNGRLQLPWAVCLAAGLAAMDFCYPLLFPSYIANTMGGALWLMQTADLWGVLGVTALLGAVNGGLVDVLVARKEGRAVPWRIAAPVLALFVGALVYGAVRVHVLDAEVAAAPKLKVGLVQANVGGVENHVNRGESIRRHVQATRELAAQGVDLVVWPEGALARYVRPDSNIRDEVLGGTSVPLLFGATRADVDATGERVPFNTAFLSDAQGRVLGHYDKTVLLAFGEYVPGGETFPQIYRMLPYASHFGRGQTTLPLVLGDWRLGTFICYEDIVPRFVQKIMEPSGGRRPDVMMNITNDSWYGDTTEPPIHLSLARYRAIEHRRALVRSTNTGISALVSPTGRIEAATGTYREQTLVGEVPKMTGSTVYEVVGDWVGYASLLLCLVALVRPRRSAVAA